jgi:hypothetical protein
MKIFSLVLVTIGIVVLMYAGISLNRQKTILDVGGIKATATEHQTLLPPIFGAISLVGGVVLLAVNKRRMYATKAA